MTLTETELLTAAMELDSQARARIAQRLFEGVAEASTPSLSPAWVAEIQHRAAPYDRGEVQAIPGEKVIAELKAKYRR